jgi:hypothetical protein
MIQKQKSMTKKLILIASFLLAISGYKAQEEKYPETVIIKTFESLSNTGADETDTKIITITPGGEVETKPLLLVNFVRPDYLTNYTSNQLKIKTEIQRWRNQGFNVKVYNTIFITSGLMLSTYILEKN